MRHCGTKEIRTLRLTLRRFVPEDVPAMFRNWASDPEVTQYLTWPAHSSQAVTEWVIADWVSSYSKADFYQWAIVLRRADRNYQGICDVSWYSILREEHRVKQSVEQ